MKNDQKNNPFLNPELQNLQNSLNQIKRAYSGYSQIILPPDSLSSRIHQLQEEIVKPYRQIFSVIHAHHGCLVNRLSLQNV